MANKDAATETHKQPDIAFFKGMKMMYGDADFVKSHVMACIAADEVAGIMGKAGIGKTDIVHQMVDELSEKTGQKWGFRVIQLQHLEKEDIAGFPFPDPNDAHSVTMRLMKRLPRKGHCEERGIIFLDEFNRADKTVTNACFPLMEEGRIGDWEVPPGWHTVIAGNISDDNYTVNEAEKDPAIRRRVCWVGQTCNSQQWLKYAEKANVHSTVRQYIAQHPDDLYDVVAHASGAIGACPASWSKVSNSMHLTGSGKIPTSKISGNIGLPTAVKFEKWVEDQAKAPPPPAEILLKFSTDKELQKRVKGMSSGELATLSGAIIQTAGELKLDSDKASHNLAEFLQVLSSDAFEAFIEQAIQIMTQQITDKNSALGTQQSDILSKLLTEDSYKAKMRSVDAALKKLEA